SSALCVHCYPCNCLSFLTPTRRSSDLFDHVVAVSEPIRQELLAAGVPADRISRIANGLDVIPFQQPLLPTERAAVRAGLGVRPGDRKSTRLNSSHVKNSYAVFCLNKIT